MHTNPRVGRVTSSTGNLDSDGQIVGLRFYGYRGAGTALDPGRPVERPGFHDRISRAIWPPELVAEQLAGIRRMLRFEADQ